MWRSRQIKRTPEVEQEMRDQGKDWIEGWVSNDTYEAVASLASSQDLQVGDIIDRHFEYFNSWFARLEERLKDQVKALPKIVVQSMFDNCGMGVPQIFVDLTQETIRVGGGPDGARLLYGSIECDLDYYFNQALEQLGYAKKRREEGLDDDEEYEAHLETHELAYQDMFYRYIDGTMSYHLQLALFDDEHIATDEQAGFTVEELNSMSNKELARLFPV